MSKIKLIEFLNLDRYSQNKYIKRYSSKFGLRKTHSNFCKTLNSYIDHTCFYYCPSHKDFYYQICISNIQLFDSDFTQQTYTEVQMFVSKGCKEITELNLITRSTNSVAYIHQNIDNLSRNILSNFIEIFEIMFVKSIEVFTVTSDAKVFLIVTLPKNKNSLTNLFIRSKTKKTLFKNVFDNILDMNSNGEILNIIHKIHNFDYSQSDGMTNISFIQNFIINIFKFLKKLPIHIIKNTNRTLLKKIIYVIALELLGYVKFEYDFDTIYKLENLTNIENIEINL